MGNGWHEWPLVLFTVLGQCVAGGIIITGFAWLDARGNALRQQRIVYSMFFLWALMGLAFIASVLHLGSPLRAFNSLNRIGYSALSNEIATGSLFFAAGGFWWLLALLNKLPARLAMPWLLFTMLLGVIFVLAMTRVYQIDTVATWHTSYTTLGFFMTVLLGGPLLGFLLLTALGCDFFHGKLIAAVSLGALFITLATALLQTNDLATIHSSVQQASALIPHYGGWQLLRIALLASGLGCWLWLLFRHIRVKIPLLATGFVLVLAGELIGRLLFYGLHMTVGVAVGG